MRGLSSSDCLSLWEQGSGLHPVDQSLLALREAFPGSSTDDLADWPLGRRNQALVALRCSLFGPRLAAWATCAKCGEKVEFELDGAAISSGQPAGDDTTVAVKQHSFRLPTSRDLARIASEADVGHATRHLIERCLISGSREISDQDFDEIGERMASADPLAELRITLDCPECCTQWEENLDIVTFLWAEIASRVKRLLLDVHTLASAYGWSEREILALSEHRRAIYLEMARA